MASSPAASASMPAQRSAASRMTAEADANKQAAAGERYKQCLNDAVRANSIERPPSGILDDSWMVARL